MKTKKIRRLFVVLGAAFMVLSLSSTVIAQNHQENADEIKRMSLQQVLALTEEANFEVRMAEADIDKVRSQYRQTNAAFLPQISIEETGVSTNDPLNVFGFKLKQEAVTTADFNPDRLNAPDPFENFTTKFEVRQPVFNADMLYKRSAVKDQLNAAREQFQGTLHYARFQVKDTYYRLLLTNERLDVIGKSLEAARENERQANDFFEQEMISKADYLAAKVRLLDLESQQSRVQDQLQTVQDNLRFLLDMKEEVTIVPIDSLRLRPQPADDVVNADAGNSTLDAFQYRVSAANRMLKSAKFSFVPSLNLFGSYELNDEVAFGTFGESYMVGATLKWNLFSGYSKIGKVMESRAELKKAELAYQSKVFRNKLEIEQAQRSLEQAQKQLEFAESSVEQAAEDFRIRSDRYEQGMEKTTDLLNAEAKLAEARLQRLDALYQYNRSLATLELLLEQELEY